MKKRLFAMLLVLNLVFSMTAISFADVAATGGENAKVSKDEAKKTALEALKNYFELEVDEKKFETRVEYRPNYEYQAMKEYVWEIYYQMNENNSHKSIQVAINAESGKVIRMHKHEFDYTREQTTKVADITEEQAKAVSNKFIEKINPAESKLVQFIQDPVYSYGYMGRPPVYNFRYVRMLNGLKFDGNYISVGVDGSTGKVTSYSFRWDELKDIPSAIGTIESSKALEKFRSELPLLTQYIPVRNKYDFAEMPQKVKIVYGLDYTKGNILDAKEGKMLDYSGRAVTDLKVKDLTDKEKEELLKSAGASQKSSKELDKSMAESIINNKIKEIFGEGYELETVSYMEGNQIWEARGRSVWNAQFIKKGTEMRYDDRGAVTVDAMTGELISADHYMNDSMQEENFTPKLTWDEAYNKALKAAAAQFPEKVKDIKTEQIYRDQYFYVNDKRILNRTYYFSFQRTVNGIQYNDNGIHVEYDAKTGEIRSMRCTWDDKLQFPETKGIIGKEEALNVYFKNYTPELVYTYIEKQGATAPGMELKLVYRLKNADAYYPTEYIDAITGKAINYMGEEAGEDKDSVKNSLKGHWAEKELSILISQGIIQSKDLDVESEVKKIDAIKMLVNAKGYNVYNLRADETLKIKGISKDDKNYKYILLAVRYGILDNNESTFDGEQKVTREEAAELIGRLLQYGSHAKSKDIFVLPYKDAKEVAADKLGYVAICKGLGIMEGSKGYFRPKDKLTTAELVVTVYKALGSINSNQK